jgi:hypothetical protein
LTPPPLVSAQVCPPPAAIALTPLARPETAVWVVPLPSWPSWFEPQHLTPPPLVSAQVWKSPAAMATIAGLTGGGDDVGGGVVAAGDGVGGGVVAGAKLGGEAQATTSMPTTNVVATRQSQERIPCPPDDV